MATGLHGPHHLQQSVLDSVVTGVGPGAYALGAVNSGGVFEIRRVGRSDTDLNDRLKDHLGHYQHFKYGFFNTKLEAYQRECTMFHEFSPPDNVIHPDAPNGLFVTCPVCGN